MRNGNGVMTFAPIVILTTRRVMFFIIVLYFFFPQPLNANREKTQQKQAWGAAMEREP